ncbi:PREDICTED: liver carboxylesterase [Myotis brandtii]|uniref:liver carboxylesterase n=1 Tax=Myotis brandtii TaxID=109478 RepID=UPI000703F14B|nr:PREDICTED: liver carboxylesterase [Myotis brandtii]
MIEQGRGKLSESGCWGQVLGEYVSLEGFAQPVAVFLGVPFAKPPLGPLRFAPPQPAEPWTFVKNATSYPPIFLQQIATFAGCQTTTSAVMVHCLRQKSEEELLETSLKMNFLRLDLHGDPREGQPVMCSVVDGVLLPKMPEELLAEKQLNSVPCIVGINQQEFGWMIPMMMGYPISEGKLDEKTASSLLWQSYPNIPEALIPAVIEKYLGGTDDPVKKKDRFLELLGDVVFGVPAVTVARGHRGESQRLDRKGHQMMGYPISEGKLDEKTASSLLWQSYPVTNIPEALIPAVIEKYLGGTDDPVKKKDRFLELLGDVVFGVPAVTVARGHRDPNGEGLPHWPVYDQKEGYLQIGVPTQAAQKLKHEEVAFFTELLAQDTARMSPQTEHIEL